MPEPNASGTETAPNPGTGSGNGTETPATPEKGGGGTSAATRPESLPERFWDAEKGAPKIDDLVASHQELEGFKASIDSLAAQVPEKPDGYSIELPEGTNLGEGVEWKPNPDDPLLKPAREWAHKHGISARAFSELMAIHAQGQVGAIQADQAAIAKEREAMGEKADQRIEAVDKFLDARLPEDQAKALKDIAQFNDGLNALETLMGLIAGPRAGRSGGESGQDKPNLSSMTPAEKQALLEKRWGERADKLLGKD